MPLHLQHAFEFLQSRRFRSVEHRLPLALDIELARLDSVRLELARYDNELEKQLVERMARALVRMEKCAAREAADTRRRKTRALKRWEQKQLQLAEDASEGLSSKKPWEAVEALESSSTGCDWLIQQWEDLAGLLDTP